MSGVRLHKEFGVNPTIPTCCICGKGRNEVVLLGASYKGQAPMYSQLDMVPCDDCRAKYLGPPDNGVMICEARMVGDRHYPTGRFLIIKGEAFQRAFPGAVLTAARQAIITERDFCTLANIGKEES